MASERRKNPPLYTHGQRRHCSATVNLPAEARWFAQTLREMPKSGFMVWHALSEFTRHQNKVDARLSQIAKFCGLSLGPVQRAMKYFEEKEVLVRISSPHKNSVWMINPELRWNGLHEQQPMMVARFKQRCRENKQRERALKTPTLPKKSVMIQLEANEYLENSHSG